MYTVYCWQCVYNYNRKFFFSFVCKMIKKNERDLANGAKHREKGKKKKKVSSISREREKSFFDFIGHSLWFSFSLKEHPT